MLLVIKHTNLHTLPYSPSKECLLALVKMLYTPCFDSVYYVYTLGYTRCILRVYRLYTVFIHMHIHIDSQRVRYILHPKKHQIQAFYVGSCRLKTLTYMPFCPLFIGISEDLCRFKPNFNEK